MLKRRRIHRDDYPNPNDEGNEMNRMNEDMMVAAGRKAKKYAGIGALALAALIVANASIFMVDAGQYAVERTPGGELVAHQTSGLKFKVPFFSDVQFYDL